MIDNKLCLKMIGPHLLQWQTENNVCLLLPLFEIEKACHSLPFKWALKSRSGWLSEGIYSCSLIFYSYVGRKGGTAIRQSFQFYY